MSYGALNRSDCSGCCIREEEGPAPFQIVGSVVFGDSRCHSLFCFERSESESWGMKTKLFLVAGVAVLLYGLSKSSKGFTLAGAGLVALVAVTRKIWWLLALPALALYMVLNPETPQG